MGTLSPHSRPLWCVRLCVSTALPSSLNDQNRGSNKVLAARHYLKTMHQLRLTLIA